MFVKTVLSVVKLKQLLLGSFNAFPNCVVQPRYDAVMTDIMRPQRDVIYLTSLQTNK